MKINQFHSGTAVGDAITNEMLLIKDILIKNGYDSEIYAEHIAEPLKKDIKDIKSYKGDKDSILIVHHSMGTDMFDHVVSLPDKKILIYHNITPEHFFEDETIKKYIRIGLKQTRDYNKYIDVAYADSNFSRKEMIDMGYKDVGIIPVQVSLDRFDHVDLKEALDKELQKQHNIIFVGRVVKNKKQVDVIKTFAVYHRYFDLNAKLFIIGDTSNRQYVNEVNETINEFELSQNIVLTGKVDESSLKTYYKNACVFLCMSEHEGFGVPLLEAMKMNVPLLAFDSSAILETMGGAGIGFDEKNYSMLAALINEINTNEVLHDNIIKIQNKRIEKLAHTDTEKLILEAIKKVSEPNKKLSLQIQGPFETSYSLAIVNKELSLALEKRGNFDVSLYATEGPGDYNPNQKLLKTMPEVKRLWEKSQNVQYPNITIRNMFPPRAKDANGGRNYYLFGWEESFVPSQYIRDFNKYTDGIGTMSEYVTQTLIENGLKIPVKTIGIGVELCEEFDSLKPYPIKTKKKIKFLHISSAFPRKGIDVLLRGYYETFTSKDDVCLIIKSFPNKHNQVESVLETLNKEFSDHPEVEWINIDLPSEKNFSLYKACDCYVQVARGEGFGLPVAEAMLAKKPTICCNNSGLADFANEKTSLVVGYKPQTSKSHFAVSESKFPSLWFEPNLDEYKQQLMYFYENSSSDSIKEMVDNAYELIKTKYSWDAIASKWEDFINETNTNSYRHLVAMVTTWNSKCGIAEFTRMQVDATKSIANYEIFPNSGVDLIRKDEPFVRTRTWINAGDKDVDILINKLNNCLSDIVHIQFNFGFFGLNNLAQIIEKVGKNKKIVIQFHKTADAIFLGKKVSLGSIKSSLNKCAALIVHQENDKAILEGFGVNPDLIHVIPLGQFIYPNIPAEVMQEKLGIKSRHVIGSYGFLLPHKGIKEVIEAVNIIKKDIPDIYYIATCSIHESIESKNYFKECTNLINELKLDDHVKLIPDYLSNDDGMVYLEACNICVLPYKPTMESASGAVRFVAAAKRPLVVTNQPIFNEFKDCSVQIESCDKDLIAKAVVDLFNKDNSELIRKISAQVDKTSWHEISKQISDLYNEIDKH